VTESWRTSSKHSPKLRDQLASKDAEAAVRERLCAARSALVKAKQGLDAQVAETLRQSAARSPRKKPERLSGASWSWRRI